MQTKDTSHLRNLKRDAKRLARAQGITLAAALDIVAILKGHRNWSLLAEAERKRPSIPASSLDTVPDRKPRTDFGMRFGAVLFDTDAPGGGWASLDGAPARRVTGPQDLGPDALWWTNLSYEAFFQTSDAWRFPKLRHDGYLVVRPALALRELGDAPATPAGAAERVAQAFQGVMRRAVDLASACFPELAPSAVFQGNSLREDLRGLLPPAEFPREEVATVFREQRGWVDFTALPARRPPGGSAVFVRRPRLLHARAMVDAPVPTGPYEFVPAQALGDDPAWRTMAQRRPLLVGARLRAVSQRGAQLFGIPAGVHPQDETPSTRVWLPYPEFERLDGFATLEIVGAYAGERHTTLRASLAPPLLAFLDDDANARDWHAGVVAETLWRAALVPSVPAPGAPRHSAAVRSWQGAWIHAADRIALSRAAENMLDAGWTSASYGLGWLRVWSTDDRADACREAAGAIGLLPVDGMQAALLAGRPR